MLTLDRCADRAFVEVRSCHESDRRGGGHRGTRRDAESAAGDEFHLPDGPEAEARDARMAAYAAEYGFMPAAAECGGGVVDEQS